MLEIEQGGRDEVSEPAAAIQIRSPGGSTQHHYVEVPLLAVGSGRAPFEPFRCGHGPRVERRAEHAALQGRGRITGAAASWICPIAFHPALACVPTIGSTHLHAERMPVQTDISTRVQGWLQRPPEIRRFVRSH